MPTEALLFIIAPLIFVAVQTVRKGPWWGLKTSVASAAILGCGYIAYKADWLPPFAKPAAKTVVEGVREGVKQTPTVLAEVGLAKPPQTPYKPKAVLPRPQPKAHQKALKDAPHPLRDLFKDMGGRLETSAKKGVAFFRDWGERLAKNKVKNKAVDYVLIPLGILLALGVAAFVIWGLYKFGRCLTCGCCCCKRK